MSFGLKIEEGEVEADVGFVLRDLKAGDLFKRRDSSADFLYVKTDEADWNAFCLTTSQLMGIYEDESVVPYRGKLTISRAV